ncbi:MAG: dihydrolipoyllysine-residue acetyltransferase [Bdellovibrionaceae bacterium]|nr:dihydrolipoyllysine-residue acetyltransferase [Pseudobdellovibrionaceae bacterium]
MAFDLKLPELGEGVTEGELIKWLVKPGDTVKADQSVAEIMTDKATVEVPTTRSGVIKELKFKAGEVIKVESTILTLEESGGAIKSTTPTAPAAKPAAAPPTNGHAFNPPTTTVSANGAAGGTFELKLPELGEGVTEGELIKWLVKPGDTVKPDQSIAEIMTDKATVEVPTSKGGTVKELKFKAGDVVKVESVLLTLSTDGGSTAVKTAPASQATTAPQKVHASQPERSMAAAASTTAATSTTFYPPVMDSKVLATPSTRRLAREMQIDINGVSGTGLAGRVTREDILKQLDSVSISARGPATSTTNGSISFPKPGYSSNMANAEERVALKGIRKKIAENMQMAKHIIPHFTLMDEVDVTELVAFRESMKDVAEKAGTKITYLPLVMKALIATIREFPQFNASIDDQAQEIVYKKYFNLGFAADTPNGLVVPVIKGADQKSVLDLSKEILDLSKRARDNKLKIDEMKGATITITNIGSVGGTYATPIINHPEVAILGMYKIQDRLELTTEGKVISKKYMNFTITADHRLIDGAVAARFLKSFLGRIQKPALLMLDMH